MNEKPLYKRYEKQHVDRSYYSYEFFDPDDEIFHIKNQYKIDLNIEINPKLKKIKEIVIHVNDFITKQNKGKAEKDKKDYVI